MPSWRVGFQAGVHKVFPEIPVLPHGLQCLRLFCFLAHPPFAICNGPLPVKPCPCRAHRGGAVVRCAYSFHFCIVLVAELFHEPVPESALYYSVM